MDTSVCLLPPPQERGKYLQINGEGQFPVSAPSRERAAAGLRDLVPVHNMCYDPVTAIIINQIRCMNLNKNCAQ